MSDIKRIAFIPYDKKHRNYTEADIVVGELIIDSETGYAWIKVKSGELIPLRGAGYIDLINYIASTMAIAIPYLFRGKKRNFLVRIYLQVF